MAEAIFRIPSKAVQYGYIEFTQEMGGLDPESLAYAYVNYVYAFQKAEQDAIKAIQEGVSAPVSASQEAPEEKAKELLNEGLGGVTEISDEEFEQKAAAAEAEMGGKAPWDQKVDALKKPWETGETASKAVTEDW